MNSNNPLSNLNIAPLRDTLLRHPDLADLFSPDEQLRLGQLALIAQTIAIIQETPTPEFRTPHLLLLAADHGAIIAHQPNTPCESSCDRIQDIARGKQFINVLCRQNSFAYRIIDAGLAQPPATSLNITSMSPGRATADFFHGPAMTPEQCHRALEHGRQLVSKAYVQECNIISIGLVARGARVAAALWAYMLANIPLPDSITSAQIATWAGNHWGYAQLQRLLDTTPQHLDPLDLMARYGGFELVMAVGALLQAASHRITILIDNFPMLCALLAAHALNPNVTDYVLLTQIEQHTGMERIAHHLHIQPILRLGLYASESIGSLLAYPMLQAALHLLALPGSSVSR